MFCARRIVLLPLRRRSSRSYVPRHVRESYGQVSRFGFWDIGSRCCGRALCERHVGNFNLTLRPYGEGKMEMLSVDVTWRIALVSAVFAADLLMFISHCREELRDWRVSRYYPLPVA